MKFIIKKILSSFNYKIIKKDKQSSFDKIIKHFTNKEELHQRQLERAKKASFLRQQAAYIEALKNKGKIFRDATGRMVHGDDELQSFELHDDQKRREGLPTSFERFCMSSS